MLYRLFTLLILLLYAPAWGATYNIGTGQTYETFTAFFAAVTPAAGDTIDGGNGTFAEAFTVPSSGSSGNLITYQNFTLDATGNNVGIYSINKSYLKFENITITGATSYGFMINSTEGNNIQISYSNCAGNSNGKHGFYIEDDGIARTVNAITYTNCSASANGSAGYHIYSTNEGATYFGSDGVTYTNCLSDGNALLIDHHGFSAYRAYNVTYTGCISRNTNKVTSEGHGFVSDDYSTNIKYLRCTSYANEGHGIIVSHKDANGVGQANTAQFCLVYGNLRGITVNGGAAEAANNIKIEHNTVVNNTETGITLMKNISAATIQNNILSGNGGYGISADDSDITATVEYNLTYGNTLGAVNNVTNENGVTTDPLLNASYGLQGNSPAKDAGTVLYTYAAHPGDFIGAKVYGAAPDIGAIEYQDHTFGGWFFDLFIPTIFNLCASTNANCYTQP